MGTLRLSTQQLQVLALIDTSGIWGSPKGDSSDPFEMVWLDVSLPQNRLHIGSVRALSKKGALEAAKNHEGGGMKPDWPVHATPAGNPRRGTIGLRSVEAKRYQSRYAGATRANPRSV